MNANQTSYVIRGVHFRTCGRIGGEEGRLQKSLELRLPLGMGAGAWAFSVEKTEKAIFSQHENTKQNFRYSIVAPRVRKQPRRLGSGDERIMQRNSCWGFSAGSSGSFAPGNSEWSNRRWCWTGLVLELHWRSYEESMERREDNSFTPGHRHVLSESVTAQNPI